MPALMRQACVFGAALLLAVISTAATGLPRRAYAGCGEGVSWNAQSELSNSQTSDTTNGQIIITQQTSQTSVQHSSDGQTFTDQQTRSVNPDGSSNTHEDVSYTDSTGQGCNSNGQPQSSRSSRDEEKDSKGNRKEHYEAIIRKNGKCEKYVRDREWDRAGNLIKDVQSTTEVPCSDFNLEWSRDATTTAGGWTTRYGPDTALILLSGNGSSYLGSYRGQFKGTISGRCYGTLSLPISVQVTAKEDEFEDLDFEMTVTSSQTTFITCPEFGASTDTTKPVTFTRTFTLPAKDGASKVFSSPMAGGQLIDTFTLRKQGP